MKNFLKMLIYSFNYIYINVFIYVIGNACISNKLTA